MTLRRVACCCLAIALVAPYFFGSSPAIAKSDIQVLHYDKDGRALGLRKDQLKKQKKQTSIFRTNRKYDPQKDIENRELVLINPPQNFSRSLQLSGYKVTEKIKLPQLGMVMFRVRIPAAKTIDQGLAKVQGLLPGVTIDANHRYRLAAGTSRSRLHARASIGWKAVSNSCGKGIRIGMIDAGLDTNHTALKGQDITFRSFHRKGRKPASPIHGTAIASMLVGKSEWGGLLPGASLYAANMFETTKSGQKVGNAVSLIKSIDWLASNHVQVVNLSIAGADNKALQQAFKHAKQKGLVMVAAAGNWGRDAGPAYPAAYKDVLAVTALSNKKEIYKHANRGDYIDFAAPGVRIWTAVPGGGQYQTGTSFAAPYITTLAAVQIHSMRKTRAVNATSLRQTLKNRTIDLGPKGKDETFGWGLVNAQPRCK